MDQTAPVSSLQRAAAASLNARSGLDLDDFIRDRRSAGASYEAIARELLLATDGAVRVVGRTVRRWSEPIEEEVAS